MGYTDPNPLNINAAELRQYLETVKPIYEGWRGDILDLDDVHKDAAVMCVVRNTKGLADEVMLGESNVQWLFELLYDDPGEFAQQFVANHIGDSETEFLEQLNKGACYGHGEKLLATLKQDHLKFAGDVATYIYLHLEDAIRQCLLDAYGDKDEPELQFAKVQAQ